MANEELLKILKQGVVVWNEWRKKNYERTPDLSQADLHGADLRGATLSDANLTKANLRGANLSLAYLYRANLYGANLNRVDLSVATLNWANLSQADLSGADLSQATIGGTTFANIDLRTVKGLKTVIHMFPSTVGIDTIYRSRGNIPEVFLRGCGVPETMITYIASLVGKPIQFYSAFISYSNKDQEFAERLHADLQSKDVRVWFAPEDLKIGDKLRDTIDEAIRIYDKLMVVLSENSINSAWVRREVKTALEKEKQRNRTVLFPIRLDDAVMDSTEQWADDIRRDRHIGDFRNWKNPDDYQNAFARLLRDLQAESEKGTA